MKHKGKTVSLSKLGVFFLMVKESLFQCYHKMLEKIDQPALSSQTESVKFLVAA